MDRSSQNQTGFTLIEILIVVIILAILATIVSQVTVSKEDVKLNTLKTNLNILRKAINLYHHQHNQTYPGQKKWDRKMDAKIDIKNSNMASTLFILQITQYTDASGDVKKEKDLVE